MLTNFLSNRAAAILSAFALAISAWHLQLSRTAYEGQFALLFYLLGIFVFLQIKRNKYLYLVLSMIIFALAFYSYSGTKLIFIPVILAMVIYKYKELNKKQIVGILVGIFLVFASFFLLSKFQNASSYGGIQFFFQDKRVAANAVELERRASLEPGPVKWFYYNKFTYWSKVFINHYSYAFSPQYFFTTQEGNGIFSMWNRGQLYLIEAPLLLLGVFYLFQKKRREFWLLTFFLIIAPLPSGLGADPITYTVRSSFMLPWLMMLIGTGIYAISYFCKNFKLTIFLYLLLFMIYIYSVGGYLTQYYFDWMVYGSKYYSKGTQDLVFLIGKEKTKFNQVIIAGATDNIFLHYAFYNKLDPKFVQKALKRTPIKVENIYFINNCLNNGMGDPKDLVTTSTLFVSPIACFQSVKPDYIMTADDKSEKYWDVYQIHDQ